MFFNKKKKSNILCESCDSTLEKNFSFCPYCGENLLASEDNERDFGMLGKSDESSQNPLNQQFNSGMFGGLGITDKMISGLFNTLAKSLEKELKDMEKQGELHEIPNGISIQLGNPSHSQEQKKKQSKSTITKEQLDRMAELPRSTAKSNFKRINNKLIYELSTPGIQSAKDIILSKTESGYEVKAIGKKKVYVNNLAVNLPLKRIAINKDKTFVEFSESQ